MPCFSLADTEGQMSIKNGRSPALRVLLLWQRHVAIEEVAWLFQSHVGVAVEADRMQNPKPAMKKVHH